MKNIESLKMLVETPEEEIDKNAKDSILEITLKELFSTKNLAMKTDLSDQLILAMARGEVFAERYQSTAMKSLIFKIQELSVSKDRQGRAEFVELVKNSQEPFEEGDSSLMRRLFNGS